MKKSQNRKKKGDANPTGKKGQNYHNYVSADFLHAFRFPTTTSDYWYELTDRRSLLARFGSVRRPVNTFEWFKKTKNYLWTLDKGLSYLFLGLFRGFVQL